MDSRKLTLHELPPSPNTVKVRLALAYKGLPYESRPLPKDQTKAVMAFDRSEVVRLSGQPLTPMLMHGETVVFDSGAILRYLDGNFPGTPRLFSSDYQTMKEIEGWEMHGRAKVSEPIGMTFGQFFAPTPDRAQLDQACSLLHAATAKVEERLGQGKWLVGSEPTAADFTLAPFVALGTLSDAAKAEGPVNAFFHQHLKLGDGRDQTRDWVKRVMAYDKKR